MSAATDSEFILITFHTTGYYYDERPPHGMVDQSMRGRDFWIKELFESSDKSTWMNIDSGAFLLKLPDSWALLHTLLEGFRQRKAALMWTRIQPPLYGTLPKAVQEQVRAFGLPCYSIASA